MASPDLFGFKKPRAPRRVLAHWSDVGDHGCKYQPGNTCVALFECARCGWESGWMERRNKTHVLEGVPCEKCNTEKEEMTDPRIEALIDAVQAEGLSFKHAIHGDDERTIAARILAAADAAAWRPIADCETMKPVLVLQGLTQLVAQKIMDAELSDAPVWRVVEGKTNEDSGSYLVYLHPAPTYWRPLHATPEGEPQG